MASPIYVYVYAYMKNTPKLHVHKHVKKEYIQLCSKQTHSPEFYSSFVEALTISLNE